MTPYSSLRANPKRFPSVKFDAELLFLLSPRMTRALAILGRLLGFPAPGAPPTPAPMSSVDEADMPVAVVVAAAPVVVPPAAVDVAFAVVSVLVGNELVNENIWSRLV